MELMKSPEIINLPFDLMLLNAASKSVPRNPPMPVAVNKRPRIQPSPFSCPKTKILNCSFFGPPLPRIPAVCHLQ